jgi:hypothetical protein
VNLTMQGMVTHGGYLNLQSTLSASSASNAFGHPPPHHPITCQSQIALHEDNSLECDHTRTEPKDLRTQTCIDHSIALLLIELATEWNEGTRPQPAVSEPKAQG